MVDFNHTHDIRSSYQGISEVKYADFSPQVPFILTQEYQHDLCARLTSKRPDNQASGRDKPPGFWVLGSIQGRKALGGVTNEAVAGESLNGKTLSLMEASSEQSLLEK